MKLSTTFIVVPKNIFPETYINVQDSRLDYVYQFPENTTIYPTKELALSHCTETETAVPFSVAIRFITDSVHYDS